MHQSYLFVIRRHALVCEYWVVNAPTLLQRLLRVVHSFSLHWVKWWREEVNDEFSGARLFIDQRSQHLNLWLLLLLHLGRLRQRTTCKWSSSIVMWSIVTNLKQNLFFRWFIHRMCFRSTDIIVIIFSNWTKEDWHYCGEITAFTLLGCQEGLVHFKLDFLLVLWQ